MKHKVSLIITTRNESQSMLDATITGLLRTAGEYEIEILVIDDASKVPVASKEEEVLLLRNPGPNGVVSSRRYGASVASGDVLLWTDAHMTFAPDWLDRMMANVDSGALLCPTTWNYELTRCLCSGANIEWWTTRDYEKGHSPGFTLKYRERHPGPGAVEVPMIAGACYMILRDSYYKLGGFSPLLREHGVGDQDISIRAWMAGVGVKCVTDAKVGHLFRSKLPTPVTWDDHEFNQLVTVKTVFEEATVEAFEVFFEPFRPEVLRRLDAADWRGWRKVVQSHRQIGDEEFFRRIEPSGQSSPKEGQRQPGKAIAARRSGSISPRR